MRSGFVRVIVGLLLGSCVLPSYTNAAPRPCQSLLDQKQWLAAAKCIYQGCRKRFQARRFVAAGRCFHKGGQDTKKRPAFKLKSFYLRRFSWGSVLSMQRAAKATKTPQAALYREQALRWLLAMRRGSLRKTASQKLRALQVEKALRQAIGYATLQVETGHPRASTCLQGLQFKRCIDGSRWTMQLRPGAYKMFIRYPGAPPLLRSRRFSIAPNSRKSMVFVPPKKSKQADLQVRSTPPGAQVFIDSVYIGKTPLTHRTFVGVHQVELKKLCHELVSRAVQVRLNKANLLHRRLRPEGPLVTWRAQQKRQRGVQMAGWTLLGGGGLLVVMGAVAHIVSSTQHSAALGALDPVSFQRSANQGNLFRTLGWVGLGSGVAVAIGGGVLLLSQRLPPRSSLPCQMKPPPQSK